MTEESIRVFIIDNNTETVIESNILTVKNENVPNNTNNTNKKQGIYLTPLDGLNGSYYLYKSSLKKKLNFLLINQNALQMHLM